MSDSREIVQAVIDAIENMEDDDLLRYPALAQLLPRLYESRIVDDDCVHSYNDRGECVCGSSKTDK